MSVDLLHNQGVVVTPTQLEVLSTALSCKLRALATVLRVLHNSASFVLCIINIICNGYTILQGRMSPTFGSLLRTGSLKCD